MLRSKSRKATVAALAVCAVLLAVGWQGGAAGTPTVVDLASHGAQQQTLASEALDDAASGCGGDAPGMANPAAVYCQELGYEYQVVDAAEGQHGICVLPDGSECDGWGFLQGKCGQSYSYCATQGYDLVTKSDGKNSFSAEYGVCVRDGQEVGSVTELMGLAEKATKGSRRVEQAPSAPKEEASVGIPPTAFDWTSYNGQDWVTSVKDQGYCGSCWAFSAVGTTEAVYNIDAGNPSLEPDLSEEYLVSDCYPDWDQSCCGGWQSEALKFIRDNGIPDEACLPYDSYTCSCGESGCESAYCDYYSGGSCANATCDDKCVNWASRLETIATMGRVSTDPSRIKQELVDRGPLAVCLGVLEDVGGYWDGDIYRCTDDETTNHCIVLTGYNDNDAGGYWIAKNSWGTDWPTLGAGGYFKVGYGECSIENWVYYASLVDQSCTSYTSTDVPKAIPNPGTVTSNINVADSFTLSDIHVGPLNITHPYDDDLDVYLISPAGTRVELFTDIGGSGDNFSGTAFDDESFYPIALNDDPLLAPFTWTFSPEGVLADLNGESFLGQWRLEVTDDLAGNAGTLNSWELELCHDVSSGDGASPTSSVAVGTHAYAFGRDAGGSYWNRHWNGTSWEAWLGLGGVLSTSPSAVAAGADVYVFGLDAGGGLWYQRHNGGTWGGWQGLGGVLSGQVSAAATAGNNVYVFGRDAGGGYWNRHWDGTSWEAWSGLGGVLSTSPSAVAAGADVYVSGLDAGGGLWYQRRSGGAWGGWQGLGGVLSGRPSAAAPGSTDVYVFGLGGDSGLWYRHSNGTIWQDWSGLGGILAD
ncbi:MAG: DUF333 domain-containing protein [Dehalococcoidia bacterium]|nr:DUF333 domain-containing protein [Dehalococcoidia bacterium]